MEERNCPTCHQHSRNEGLSSAFHWQWQHSVCLEEEGRICVPDKLCILVDHQNSWVEILCCISKRNSKELTGQGEGVLVKAHNSGLFQGLQRPLVQLRLGTCLNYQQAPGVSPCTTTLPGISIALCAVILPQHIPPAPSFAPGIPPCLGLCVCVCVWSPLRASL